MSVNKQIFVHCPLAEALQLLFTWPEMWFYGYIIILSVSLKRCTRVITTTFLTCLYLPERPASVYQIFKNSQQVWIYGAMCTIRNRCKEHGQFVKSIQCPCGEEQPRFCITTVEGVMWSGNFLNPPWSVTKLESEGLQGLFLDHRISRF